MLGDRSRLERAHVRVTGPGFSPDQYQSGDRVHRGVHPPNQTVTSEEIPFTTDTSGFLMTVALVFDEAEEIMLGRHKDYGPDNIARAYPDPLTALVVRMSDKLERIKNLLRQGDGQVYGERLRDSWIDLANYALIGVMVQDGTWPGVKRDS